MSSATESSRGSTSAIPRPLPKIIRSKIEDARSLIGRYILAQAIIRWCIWSLIVFWLFGFLDYLPASFGATESPRWVRGVMLGIWGVGSVAIFFRHLLQPWMVRWTDEAIALLIERQNPQFESSLITTVQAAKPNSKPSDSTRLSHPSREGLLAIAERRAISLVPEVDIPQLVRTGTLRVQLFILGALLVFSILAGTLKAEWTWHWAQRFLALSDTPWPRSVKLGVVGLEFEVPGFSSSPAGERYSLPFIDGRVAIPIGQSGVLKSFADRNAKSVPDLCTVHFVDVQGNRGRANMRRMNATESQQHFQLDGPPLENISQSLSLTLSGGDARIPQLKLEAVEPPMVRDIQLHVRYPAYLQRSTQSRWGEETLPFRTGMRLPQGTEVTLHIKANKSIQRCESIIAQATGETQATPVINHQQLIDEQTSAGVDNWTFNLGELKSNLLMEFRLWDEEGICSSRVQQYVLSTLEDKPPQVEMTLDGIGYAITELASIPVEGTATDEYDVNQVWLQIAAGDQAPLTIPTPPQTQGDGTALPPGSQSIAKTLDCREMRDSGKIRLEAGSTFSITLVADDYFDLQNEPHVGKSSTVQLNVVTPDQLLLILDRREASMRRRLEQIITELNQLRDLLVNVQRRASETSEGTPNSGQERFEDDTPEQAAERVKRIQLIRMQQATTQILKSGSELAGVEKEIQQIGKELINNRIDSIDRRTRWHDKIQSPIRQLLDTEWLEFSTKASELEKGFGRETEEQSQAPGRLVELVRHNDSILSKLQSILADMLEIQDQTAIIDMLRDIIDSSNELIDETKNYKKDQDRKALELFQ